jgi:hypothetical protein
MGQSEVLLGTYSGTHRELGKFIEHLKRTYWEPQKPQKPPPPPPQILTYMKHLVVTFSKNIVPCKIESYSMYIAPSVDHFFSVI